MITLLVISLAVWRSGSFCCFVNERAWLEVTLFLLMVAEVIIEAGHLSFFLQGVMNG